eukprot:gb/GECG01013162.1/.p1 GENE.gb/GECG01013162.1/~~gb/GECG01013162.1/.p1  ORF type:complete len:573 (+),score=84.44 gb/GECG01013162.1/:1-1719(+)
MRLVKSVLFLSAAIVSASVSSANAKETGSLHPGIGLRKGRFNGPFEQEAQQQQAAGINDNVTAFRTALTQGGFDWITDTAKKAIDKYFTTISIPKLTFEKDEVKGKVYDISCDKISVGNVGLSVDDKLNGKVSGFQFHCNAKWELKLEIWPHPHKHGSADASTSNAGATLAVGVSHDNSGHATVNPDSVDVNVGDLDVHIHGGVIGDILDFFKNIFKHWIEKHIEEAVEKALKKVIDDKANHALQRIPVVINPITDPPYNVSTVKMGITSVPHVSSEFIGAGLQGYFVDSQNPSKLPPFTHPSLPNYEKSTANQSYLQLLISGYTVESFFWVFQSRGLLEKTVTPSNVPPGFPLKLNTQDPVWKAVAPKMPSVYPKDDVHIVFEIQSGTKVQSSENDDSFSVNMPIAMDIQAMTSDGAKSAFILGCPMKSALKVSVKERKNDTSKQTSQVIAGHMEYLSCELQLENSTVGKVHYSDLKKGIDFAIEHLVMPILNNVLRVGFPIPSGDFVTLKNTSVKFGDDYAAIGSEISVNLTKILGDAPPVYSNYLTSEELTRIDTEFREENNLPRTASW